MSRRIDLSGKTFGKLSVKDFSHKDKANHAVWNCICECGSNTKTSSTHLISGHSTSCGCRRKKSTTKHGMSNHALYSVWSGMICRCTNKRSNSYINYGARGIYVCSRWANSVENFIIDMDGGYKKGLSLDRIDNNKGYSKENCRWATRVVQNRNTRRNKVISFGGNSLCVAEWAEKIGISVSTLENRLTVRGWSVSKSLTEPVRFKSKQKVKYV